MNIKNRQKDLLKIIEDLDISPTMYNNAVNKYKSLAGYLENNGLEVSIYPQGSFALGTVIRPYDKDKEKNYDLDFVCQINSTRSEITPKALRDVIKDILENGELYGGKLTVYDECFTIEYADIGSVGFSIDIVPAVDETYEKKQELKTESSRPDLIGTSIAIPRYSKQKVYNWITNNPKGYRKWFSEINLPFAEVSREAYSQKLLNSNSSLFSSIEEIPDELNRSSMQRVVQILKYHRDVYYSRVTHGEDIKPISAIINTVVAKIASKANYTSSPIDLLEYVLKEFAVYGEQIDISEQDFKNRNVKKDVIRKSGGKWIIENPANPEDNLADEWNKDSRIAMTFFKWITVAKKQLIDSLQLSDEDFRAKAEAAFGRLAVQNSWGSKYNAEPPKVISSSNYAKPWRSVL